MRRRHELMANGDGLLPPNYRRLEYLKNNSSTAGEAAYIDTGLILQKGCIVSITFLQPNSSANRVIYGWRYAGSYTDGQKAMLFMDSGNRFITVGVRTGQSGAGRTDCFPVDEKTTVVFDTSAEKIYVDGVEFTGNYNFANGKAFDTSGTSGYSPYLYAFNNGGSIGGSTYLCSIYDYHVTQSGNDIQHMIPAVNPDGVYGLYDIVSHQFYTSPNGKQFTGK